MSGLFLGVDVGTTKTVALLGDGEGTIVGWGRRGTGNIYAPDGEAAAVAEVLAAVRDALAMAPGAADVTAAFCVSGVDWPEDAELWRGIVRAELPAVGQASFENDGFAMLRWGSPDGIGVAVSAGTGPAVAARGPAAEFSSGFWIQEALGGEALGNAALRCAVDAHLGLGPPTALSAALLALTGCRDVPDLLWSFTRRERPRRLDELKSAAREVLRAAADGDAVATRLVTEQAVALAAYAWACARQAGLAEDAPMTVVLGGSLLTSEIPVLRDAVVGELGHVLPNARPVTPDASPAAGALLDAYALGGVPLTDALRARVRTAGLPASLFVT